ncbi:hypothetical protein PR048_025479 [Dryococelus australis]|uniref:PiggyBac transposable element-derived protein domain-containing protein n=1 Tax=Dryococelus australis TaxID=614101 RepID=A0ABQ9GRH2_9NEOP|nr:hypothetical protein PR048_025479 [Dryococelus australis]
MFLEPTLQFTNNCFSQKRDANSHNTWLISLIWIKISAGSRHGTKYLLNGFPYLGKDDNQPPNQSLSEHVVIKLMASYLGKGTNVTTDNSFTCVSLAEKLKMQSTSLIGTVNRARREIPQSVRTKKLYNTVVMKNNKTTWTVYWGMKNKNVPLLSTLHPNISIGNVQRHLAEIVSLYNSTKYGVDVLGKMARKYSVTAASWRWRVQVFYNIHGLAGIDTWVLFKQITRKKISWQVFLQVLSVELLSASAQSRQNRCKMSYIKSSNQTGI